MTTPSITSITDAQKEQYLRFVTYVAEKALIEAGLDEDRIQKLIENSDEFQSHIMTGILELSVSDQCAEEEVESVYGYSSGYQPKGVGDQVARLFQLFPELETVAVSGGACALPPHAEGWFAIPRWEKLAPTYNAALEKVFSALSQTRDGQFYNWRELVTGPDRLRQHPRTNAMLKMLGDQQDGNDILIVPAQFGFRHRGRSVRRAREVMNASEFGLGAFALGIMLLTHPERLRHRDDLWIDCAGDEYDVPNVDGPFSQAPFFYFLDGRLGFSSYWVDVDDTEFGSASGFVIP